MRIPKVTIYERSPGNWSVRWREHGKQREIRGHATEAEADNQRFQVETRLRSGLPGLRRTITLRELIERWWDDYVLTLDASTRTNYQTPTARVLHAVGDADANALNTPAWIVIRDDLAAVLPSNRLVNDCLKIASSAYQRGYEWGVVEENPVRAVPRLPEPSTSLIIPTRADVAMLGMRAPTHSAQARLAVAATVGLRPGEQLALDWRHIREATIRIEQALKMDGTIGPTKTKKPRTVPAPGPVLRLLEQWRRRTRHRRPKDPVFPSTHGVRINPSRWRAEIWYPWREIVDVEHLHWRLLRHYYASAVAAAGGTMLQCSRWMGHASIKTTADRYADLFDEDAGPVMERLG